MVFWGRRFSPKIEQKQVDLYIVVKLNSFVLFLEEIDDPKKPFRNDLTFRYLGQFMFVANWSIFKVLGTSCEMILYLFVKFPNSNVFYCKMNNLLWLVSTISFKLLHFFA